MHLRIATNDAIDDVIATASPHFFSGSEEEARDDLGPFDASNTSFILAYDGDDPLIWRVKDLRKG